MISIVLPRVKYSRNRGTAAAWVNTRKTRSGRAWLVLIAGLALSLRRPATATSRTWLVLSLALRAILGLKLGLTGVP